MSTLVHRNGAHQITVHDTVGREAVLITEGHLLHITTRGKGHISPPRWRTNSPTNCTSGLSANRLCAPKVPNGSCRMLTQPVSPDRPQTRHRALADDRKL